MQLSSMVAIKVMKSSQIPDTHRWETDHRDLLTDSMWDIRERKESRMAPDLGPKKLERWSCHLLIQGRL